MTFTTPLTRALLGGLALLAAALTLPPSDGPGSGGGYRSGDSPGLGGGYRTPPVAAAQADGPGSGGGYRSADGPGVGGGY